MAKGLCFPVNSRPAWLPLSGFFSGQAMDFEPGQHISLHKACRVFKGPRRPAGFGVSFENSCQLLPRDFVHSRDNACFTILGSFPLISGTAFHATSV
jgi:hypothetical protein